jgi:hypothetical protein
MISRKPRAKTTRKPRSISIKTKTVSLSPGKAVVIEAKPRQFPGDTDPVRIVPAGKFRPIKSRGEPTRF